MALPAEIASPVAACAAALPCYDDPRTNRDAARHARALGRAEAGHRTRPDETGRGALSSVFTRLKSEIWVRAYLRRCQAENVPAVVVRRGDEAAGAIFICVDKLDGTVIVYGPAPAGLSETEAERRWMSCFGPRPVDQAEANLYLAFILVNWISFARIVRGEVLVLRDLEFVQAARSLGCTTPRIVAAHILPNAVNPAIVYAMADVVLTILAVTSLSFLGLGIQPPTPEWGLMIADGRQFLFDAWWIATFPGLAIIYTGVTFALIGEGLDTALRPKG